MFDSSVELVSIILTCLVCIVPAVIANQAVVDYFSEDPCPSQGGRKPSPRRGLPDEKTLRDLARTYLDVQHELWPDAAKCGVIPPLTEEAVMSLAGDFKRRFLDKGWRPSRITAHINSVKLGAAYLRFSSDNSNPRSLAQQLTNCLKRARQEEVFIPWACICADAAVTGRVANRRGYQMSKALMTSASNGVDILFIDEIGRVARYAIEALRLGELIANLKKRFIGASDGFDSDNPQAKLMLHIFAMLHEFYSDQLSDKVLRGMADAYDRGIDISRCAFGHVMEVVCDKENRPVFKPNGRPQKSRVVDSKNAKHVVEAFTRFVVERWSPQRIAKDFNDRKIGDRTTWTAKSVTDMLRREVYVGFEYRYRTKQVRDPDTGKVTTVERPMTEWKRREVPHLRLVSDEIWQKAQARIKECSEAFAAKHPNGRRASVYPTTLVRPVCWSCGKELAIGHSGKNPSFCCLNGRNHANGCQFRGYKAISIVESVIFEAINERIFTHDFQERLVSAANQYLQEQARLPKEDEAPLMQQLKKLKARRRKLADIIEEAGRKRVKALVGKLQACERQIAGLRRKVKDIRLQNVTLPNPLTLEDIGPVLGDLRSLLAADTATSAPALRALTGPITIEQISQEGQKRPTWIATFELNAVPILAELAKSKKSPTAQSLDLLSKRGWTLPIAVNIPLVRKTSYERLGPKFKRLRQDGIPIADIAHQHKMSISRAAKILEFAETGTKSDWHPCYSKSREGTNGADDVPLYVRFAPIVAELHDVLGIPLKRTPDYIEKEFNVKISENTARGAYKYSKTVAREASALPAIT
jgi:DNA invertase Pin-like site-specific DNA recombinase